MNNSAVIIVGHQLLFQGMFFAKNMRLRRKLGQPIRGFNLEANLSIALFAVFIGLALLFALSGKPPGTINLLPDSIALTLGLILMAANLLVSMASLKDLGDSWRVGVIREQQTELVDTGIYGFTRNPYFLAYLLMFAAYTIVLQNVILLALALAGFGLVHAMILREEQYLAGLHGQMYQQYTQRVPRYLLP